MRRKEATVGGEQKEEPNLGVEMRGGGGRKGEKVQR